MILLPVDWGLSLALFGRRAFLRKHPPGRNDAFFILPRYVLAVGERRRRAWPGFKVFSPAGELRMVQKYVRNDAFFMLGEWFSDQYVR
jgi:hypothetical protein